MSCWIDYGNDKVGHSIRCSKCGEDFGDNRWLTEYFYCPNCSADMRKEGENDGV